MESPTQQKTARRKSMKAFVGTLSNKLHRRPSQSASASLHPAEKSRDPAHLPRSRTQSGRTTPSEYLARYHTLNFDDLKARLLPHDRSALAHERAQLPASALASPIGSTHVAPPIKLKSEKLTSTESPCYFSIDTHTKRDEPQAPGQFPSERESNDHDEHQEGESWLSVLTQNIPFLSNLTWENFHPSYHDFTRHQHLDNDVNGSGSDSQMVSDDVPFIESEVEIETPPEGMDDVHSSGREDYFSYPTRSSGLRKHWHTSTPLSHPFSRSRKKQLQKQSDYRQAKKPMPRNDETWNLISANETPIASADNGAPEFHPSAPGSRALSKKLQELDQLELNMFLQNFSRHTREVRLLGNSQHFARMPQWSDFAYSSDEDDERQDEHLQQDPTILTDPHKRSRLLMHIDRGLQQLHPEIPSQTTHDSNGALENPMESVQKSSIYSGLYDPTVPDTITRRQCDKPNQDEPTQIPSSANRSAKGTPTESATPSGILSNVEDTDAYESASSTMPNSQPRKRAKHHRHHYRDDHVDGVAFCIAYFLAIIEQYAPDDLDEAPVTEYRESRARSHLERLYIIAPFWEQLFHRIRALYCWENPRRTAAGAMIYFVLWYTDLLPTAFFMTLLYYTLQFRYLPPDESYLHQRVQQRMQRGIDANRLAERLKRRSRLDILDIYKRWQNTYGIPSQVMTGDIADFHEKVKNILLWRNPSASRHTVMLLSFLTAFVTLCSPYVVYKAGLFFVGFTFFGLAPLQAHYPRYRRPLNPLWWLVLGSPTDAQYAVQILRERHQRHQVWLQQHQPEKAAEADTAQLPVVGTPTSPSHMHEVRREGAPSDHPHENDMKGLSKKRLGSFLCQYHGMPGHLVITATHLYFSPLHIVGSGKHCVTRLEQIVGLRKTNSLRFWVWSSSGLKVSVPHRSSLHFHNMTHRDDAFNLLLTFGSEMWRKV
ncbi:hypothetical protein MPSI1_001985 [Malassezia psittaci]|uniref:Uncharacterized protein n=1 Tax=Malassezia psittaci TaxID=1821823 RepID=A0AAF0FBB7_9BASI|nr:hypothetical protein MPSI1_001985 [Malassezia psittaci]